MSDSGGAAGRARIATLASGLDPLALSRAAEILSAGGLVAFPTETVYGLGADAANEEAVRAIYRTKGRPSTVPLIVHIPGIDAAAEWAAALPEGAHRLAARFWPGPLTIIVPATPRARWVSAGLATVGLRVPDHPVALALLRAFGGGLAAPSANRYGRVSPTSAKHVLDDLGEDAPFVLDGGPCRVGVESTVLDLTGSPPTILRAGAVSAGEIEAVLGCEVRRGEGEMPTGSHMSPGLSLSHYAPRATVEIVDPEAIGRRWRAEGGSAETIGILAPAPLVPVGAPHLPVPEDPEGYARTLYAALRAADEQGWARIWVVPPPPDGLGAAVRDRLRRAAASRPSSGHAPLGPSSRSS